jgi:hypothetical protein
MADRKEVNAKTSYVPIERRVHPRLSVSFPISFQVISGRDSERRSPFREGNLRDVSLGGLCFTTPEIIIDNLHISGRPPGSNRNQEETSQALRWG